MSSEQFPPNADEVRLRLIVQLLNQWETELAEWQNQRSDVFPVALQLLSRNPEQRSPLPGDQLPTSHLSSMVERHRLCELLSEFGLVSQGSELQHLADNFVDMIVGLELAGLARRAPETRDFLTSSMGAFPESIEEEAGLFIDLSACVSALLVVVRDLQKVLVVETAPAAGSDTPATVANVAGTQPSDVLPPAFVDEATKQQIAIVTAIVKRSDRMRIRELEGLPGCFRNTTNTAETIVRALNRTNENLVPSCNWELKWHSEVDRTDAEVWIIRAGQK